MRELLLQKKKKMLEEVSVERYRSLTRFTGKVYLANFQLKVLMARKFSNAYQALLPLALEEEGGRVNYLYQSRYCRERKIHVKEPVVISDRALDYMKEDIISGKYRTILLVDDIVIHGRTLEKMYQKIKSWFEEGKITDYQIRIISYAENHDGKLEGQDFRAFFNPEYSLSDGEWRAVSDDIIKILNITGQPYTSDVPNMRVYFNSELGEKIREEIKKKDSFLIPYADSGEKGYRLKTYMYVSENEEPHIWNFSVRIYDYSEFGEYVIIPMVILKLLQQDNLQKYINQIKGIYAADVGEGYVEKYQDGDEPYRMVQYGLSALYGWYFVQDVFGCDIVDYSYDTQEEYMNYGRRILKDGAQEWISSAPEKLEQLLEAVRRSYQKPGMENNSLEGKEHQVGRSFQQPEDIINGHLDHRVLEDAFEKYVLNVQSKPKDDVFFREAFSRYLYHNGLLDEDGCKEVNPHRLFGYPIQQIAASLDSWGQAWMRAVLSVIDSGKGSIVSRTMCSSEDSVKSKYCFSVLYAGEENYKYLVNKYFSFLYGLEMIEQRTKNEEKRVAQQLKKKFRYEYVNYCSRKGYDVYEDDLNSVCSCSVSEKFGEILRQAAWSYIGDSDSDEIIGIVWQIMDRKEEYGKRKRAGSNHNSGRSGGNTKCKRKYRREKHRRLGRKRGYRQSRQM